MAAILSRGRWVHMVFFRCSLVPYDYQSFFTHGLWDVYWTNSQIPLCTCSISDNASFCNRIVHMCMEPVHFRIVQKVYWENIDCVTAHRRYTCRVIIHSHLACVATVFTPLPVPLLVLRWSTDTGRQQGSSGPPRSGNQANRCTPLVTSDLLARSHSW